MHTQYRRDNRKQWEESGAEVKVLPMLHGKLEQYQVNISI